MKSMTGFGSVEKQTPKLRLVVTLKAVNGRYLDIRPHIPRQYQNFESQIKKQISQQISRGTVDLYVHRKALGTEAHDVVVNEKMAEKWKSIYTGLGKKLKLSTDSLRIETIAGLPDVISVEEVLNITAAEKKLVLQSLDLALKEINKEREREGKALKAELTSQIKNLTQLVVSFRKLASSVNEELEARFRTKLNSVKDSIEVDPQRLAQEVAFYADKSDVREEITRLEEHIAMFQSWIEGQKTGACGKKLDFYCQELLREVNTIGSKSSQAKLTHLVVDAKSVVEKMREQVQNVE